MPWETQTREAELQVSKGEYLGTLGTTAGKKMVPFAETKQFNFHMHNIVP